MSNELPRAENLRQKPSFNNYASDWIACEEYNLAALNERGLLWSVMNYCWVNHRIPSDTKTLARLLNLPAEDLEKAKGALFHKFLTPSPEDQSRLVCQDLEKERRVIEDRREKMRNGGRNGGLTTQSNIRRSRHPSSHPKAPEMKRKELKRNAVVIKEHSKEHEEWLKDFEGNDSDK